METARKRYGAFPIDTAIPDQPSRAAGQVDTGENTISNSLCCIAWMPGQRGAIIISLPEGSSSSRSAKSENPTLRLHVVDDGDGRTDIFEKDKGKEGIARGKPVIFFTLAGSLKTPRW